MDERTDEFGIVGFDRDRVPVLTDKHHPATAGLDDGFLGLGEGMRNLVGAIAGDRAVRERQRGSVGDVELAHGPELRGDFDHGGVQVDTDGPHPASGRLADGPSGSATDTDNGVTERCVCVFPRAPNGDRSSKASSAVSKVDMTASGRPDVDMKSIGDVVASTAAVVRGIAA